jgi:hypothetical protein
MGLKIIASRSPWLALPPYQISWNLPSGSEVIVGGHRQPARQTDRLVIWKTILSFLKSRLKWLIVFGIRKTTHSSGRNVSGIAQQFWPICQKIDLWSLWMVPVTSLLVKNLVWVVSGWWLVIMGSHPRGNTTGWRFPRWSWWPRLPH